jgi:hypothetical protein
VQLVNKFNLSVPDTVRVLMALFRLPAHDVDLVVTANVPAGGGDLQDAAVREDFTALVESLSILDFGLFA